MKLYLCKCLACGTLFLGSSQYTHNMDYCTNQFCEQKGFVDIEEFYSRYGGALIIKQIYMPKGFK